MTCASVNHSSALSCSPVVRKIEKWSMPKLAAANVAWRTQKDQASARYIRITLRSASRFASGSGHISTAVDTAETISS
jgi:hypothetical protein